MTKAADSLFALSDGDGGFKVAIAPQDKSVTATDAATVLRTDAVSLCTGLVVVHKNRQGQLEASLFHLSPQTFSAANEAKLRDISRMPGPKVGVLITSARSCGDRMGKDDPILYHDRHVRALVRGIQMVEPIKSTSSSLSAAFHLHGDEGLLQVFHYNNQSVTSHVPFPPDILQGVLAGRMKQ